MTEHSVIDRPGREVVLDRPHRGDVRCRVLRIGRTGSVFGNVIADEVWVSGRFDGVAYAGQFFANEGSKVFGAVNTDRIGIIPGASVQAHIGPAFPAQGFGHAAVREKEIVLPEAKEAGKAPEPTPARAFERTPGETPARRVLRADMTAVPIEEAFAPLSRESLARATAVAMAAGRAAARVPLPSLV